MPKPLEIIRGDTVDILVGPLEKRTLTGWAVPTTPSFVGASPRLIVKECGSGRVLYDRTGTFASPGSAADGIAALPQEVGDFGAADLTAEHVCEVEVTYAATGKKETFPKGPAKLPVLITDDLDA